MFLTKLKAAALLLAAGVVGSVVALSAGPALADKPKADGGQKKEKKEAGPSVRGTVKAADAGKRTLTVVVLIDPTKKETVEKTFPVAGDAKVVLEDVLTKTPTLPEGILADLTEGTGVTLELSADGKAVVRVSARGPSLHASVKVMDQATNTLTVTVKEDGGLVEKTLTVAKGAKVIMDDGLGGKKKEPPREGKLTDLTEGTPVTVQLSVNRQTALGIHVRGVTVFGTLKAYDAGNRFVTVTVKEDGQLVDKTFTLAKEAQLEGDLTSGAPVTIRLSVHDKMVAAAVQVRKDG